MFTEKAGAVQTLSSTESSESLYREYVNPQWTRLLEILRLNVRYVRCRDVRLCSDDGREILDFPSGCCVSYAAPILEPIQDEAGILSSEPEYLQEAQKLCRHYGTLLVLDEVQTGIARSGRFESRSSISRSGSGNGRGCRVKAFFSIVLVRSFRHGTSGREQLIPKPHENRKRV